ncbi:MAG: TIGR02710 family CRISPR-associated protein, partial [Nitrospirae bacterium]
MDATETAPRPRMVVASVGGTPDPIIFSLNRQRPEYVVYFCSQGSRQLVTQEIRPALEFTPKDDEVLTTESAERLVPAYRDARDGVRRCMAMWDVAGETVVVDYTGGTKNMSAALVLATVDLGCRYSYVGGVERTKEGLGIVVGGREKMFYPANPWEVLGVERLKEVALLFNRARYGPARERLAELARRVPEGSRPLYRRLGQVVEGFEAWDRFDHRKARRLFGEALGKLHEVVGLLPPDGPERRFLEQAQAAARRLDEVKPQAITAYVADLVANAVRRAELEEKYEDAVARLYAAVEKLGKLTLRRGHRLDNGGLDPEAVPEPLREEFRRRYWNEEKRCLQIPLRATYRLLAALGDPLGERFEAAWPTLRPLLDQRNESILGHGTQPVGRETYERLLEATASL